MPETNSIASSEDSPDRFLTTCWTQVVASHGNSSLAETALSELCNDYYEPVVAFIRYSERDPERTRDLAHGFFAHVLDGHAFEGADPNRGRFRSYLLGAVKHFLAQHRIKANRLRRGGGVEFIAIDESATDPPNPNAAPDAEFDRRWAGTVLDRALDSLKAECEQGNDAAVFQEVRPWLLGDASHGDQARLATQLGMEPNTLKSHVSRLRKRFRNCVREEVARTLVDPDQVEEEMRSLLAVLQKN